MIVPAPSRTRSAPGGRPRGRRRRRRGAVAFLGAALTVAACSGGPASHESVLVIGDSLVAGSAPTIATGLQGRGWQPTVDGRSGWSIGKWTGVISDVVDDARPRLAVVVLGTNDCAPQCRDVADGIDEIMSTFEDAGVEQVFWLNVQEQPRYPAGAEAVNLELTRAQQRWPRLSIVDLNGTLGGNDALHIEDGVHFNAEGGVALTALMLDALEAGR